MNTLYWPENDPPSNKHLIWSAFRARAPHRRVLELGPFDGRDTVRLAEWCDSLVTVESRPENIAAVAQACRESSVSNVLMRRENIETIDLEAIKPFDAVWCVGILYHMPRPWELVRKIAAITDFACVWTHLAEEAREDVEGYRGYYWNEVTESPLAGLSPQSFWLVEYEMRRCWESNGFEYLPLEKPSPHINGGLHLQFLAKKSPEAAQ